MLKGTCAGREKYTVGLMGTVSGALVANEARIHDIMENVTTSS